MPLFCLCGLYLIHFPFSFSVSVFHIQAHLHPNCLDSSSSQNLLQQHPTHTFSALTVHLTTSDTLDCCYSLIFCLPCFASLPHPSKTNFRSLSMFAASDRVLLSWLYLYSLLLVQNILAYSQRAFKTAPQQ
jgi:hypothetical protein